mgnify:CR=1 FL=1
MIRDTGLPPLSEQDWREMVLRLAHEIRNPLATIKSATQLVQRWMRPEGEVAESLQGILVNVARIDRTLKDLQRFVRLDVGESARQPVAEAVEDVVADQLPEAQRRGVAVLVAGGPAARVLIDPKNLGAALEELLANAVRVTAAGGTVMISWVCVGEEVLLHVDDEGPGVPPELEDKILRPFFSTSAQGTGLGLNFVDKACRLAGGALSWRNLAGRGCRFTMRLPRG